MSTNSIRISDAARTAIDKTIALLKTLKPDQFEMSHWTCKNPGAGGTRGRLCDTTACLAGWITIAQMPRAELARYFGKDAPYNANSVDYERLAAGHLGQGPERPEWISVLHNLFMMPEGYKMVLFDRQPARKRHAAAIRVLEILRDTGREDWPQALRDAGIDPSELIRQDRE